MQPFLASAQVFAPVGIYPYIDKATIDGETYDAAHLAEGILGIQTEITDAQGSIADTRSRYQAEVARAEQLQSQLTALVSTVCR